MKTAVTCKFQRGNDKNKVDDVHDKGVPSDETDGLVPFSVKFRHQRFLVAIKIGRDCRRKEKHPGIRQNRLEVAGRQRESAVGKDEYESVGRNL